MRKVPAEPTGTQRSNVQRFRHRVKQRWRDKRVSADDAVDLLLLAAWADTDGHLRGRMGSYYTEAQLADWLDLGESAFYLRWKRWREAGWVADRRPTHRAVERWLCPDEAPEQPCPPSSKATAVRGG